MKRVRFTEEDVTAFAIEIWAIYAGQADNKTYDGKPLPDWDQLGRDRQKCWEAVSRYAFEELRPL